MLHCYIFTIITLNYCNIMSAATHFCYTLLHYSTLFGGLLCYFCIPFSSAEQKFGGIEQDKGARVATCSKKHIYMYFQGRLQTIQALLLIFSMQSVRFKSHRDLYRSRRGLFKSRRDLQMANTTKWQGKRFLKDAIRKSGPCLKSFEFYSASRQPIIAIL